METTMARKMWRTLEPYHGLIYFAPQAAEAYASIGLEGNRMGYFASRAAPMGAVSAQVVVATFFNFHPDLVARVIPRAWTLASPEQVLAARLDGADRMLRAGIDDAALDSAEMVEAMGLAERAAAACRPEGRPLYAGHADLPWPDPAHLRLWHAISLLREYRGDGHIAAMTAEGLTGLEALITHAASGDVPRAALQTSRSWSDAEWDAGLVALAARGLVEPDGAFTDAGRAMRDRIEAATDRLAMAPWEALGDADCSRLRELVRPWSRALVGGIGFANISVD